MPQPSAARVANQFRRNEELRQIAEQLLPRVSDAFTKVMGYESEPPPYLIEFGVDQLRPGSIAKHMPPHGGVSHSVITINPKAQGDYLVEVVKHELIHYLLQVADVSGHPEQFQAIAELVDLPKLYRD